MSHKKKSGKQKDRNQKAQSFDNFDFCFWPFDCTQKKIITVTSLFEFMPDFKVEDESGNSPNLLARFVHPDDRYMVEDAFEKVISGSSFEKIGCRMISSDNRQQYVSFHLKSRKNSRGAVEQIDCVLYHVTDEESGGKSVLTTENVFLQMAKFSPDIILVHSYGRILYINDTGVRLMKGTGADDFVGRDVKDFIHPEYEKMVQERIKEVLEDKKPMPFMEEKILCLDGTAIDVEVSTNPLTFMGIEAIQVVGRDISHRKKVEESLRKSENLYRTTIDVMVDYIHVVDRDLKITLANIAFKNWIVNLKIDNEPTGKSLRELFPFLTDSVYAEYEKVFATGEPLLTEESNILDGREIFTETRKIPIFDGNQVKLVMTVIRDTTKEKMEHRAMVKNEGRLELALEASSDGIWEWWIDSGKTYFSPRYYTMLGYEPGEFSATFESWVNLLHPEDREQAIAVVTDHVTNKIEKYELEFRLKTKEGDWKWIYARGKFVEWDKDGKPLRMVGTHIDITERKEAEKALKERESLISSIFRAAPTGIGLVINRIIMKVNDRFCQMLGYPNSDELVGKSARVFYESEEEFDRVGRVKYEAIAREGIGTVETRFVRKDGRVIDVLLSSTPLVAENLSAGVTFTALNITESKLAEKALHSALKKMEEDQKSLTEKNVALREVLNQIENEKRQIQLQIQSNVDKILVPMITNIQNRIDPMEIKYVDVLKNTLLDITSPFVNKLNSLFSKLTPREIEICNMIKSGMTSKEIAATLQISVETIHKTRYNIRRKFGILNEEINLTSFLKTI